jgi:hypothetical protein
MTSKEIRRYEQKYKNYDFKDKKSDEKIILVLRRHWLTFIFKFFPVVTAMLLLIIGHFVLSEYIAEWFFDGEVTVVFFGESLIGMLLWIIFFVLWIDYYFDAWIVTTKRIVDINQMGLFRRNVSELDHIKIQDITTEVHGIFPTLLDYGFVYVQTAGSKSRFVFEEVPHPTVVRQLIAKLQKDAIRKEEKEIFLEDRVS